MSTLSRTSSRTTSSLSNISAKPVKQPDKQPVKQPINLSAVSFGTSPPALPLHCPYCSTNASTKKGRWRIYKLGRGLRTHITLKHKDLLQGQKSNVKSVEDWVQNWLVSVNSSKRHLPLKRPPGTVRQLLDALESMAPSFVEVPGAARNWVEELAKGGVEAVKGEMENLSKEGRETMLKKEDHHGTNLYHWAAGLGDLELLKYLRSVSTTDVDLCSSMAGDAGAASSGNKRHGKSPLHYASRYGRAAVVRYILSLPSSSSPPSPSNDGTTALHLAFFGSSGPCAELLLAAGCDAKASNSWGCDAGHFAGLGGADRAVLELALSRGCSFAKEQGGGHRPTHKAAMGGHWRCVRDMLELEPGAREGLRLGEVYKGGEEGKAWMIENAVW